MQPPQEQVRCLATEPHLEALALLLLRMQGMDGHTQQLQQRRDTPQRRHSIHKHQGAAWVPART